MLSSLRKQRWIKFRLRTLLLLVGCVALLLAAWRWVTWPERTLRELDTLIAMGNIEAAESRIVFEPNYRMSAESVAHQLHQSHTRPVKRGWRDLISARQIYRPLDDGVACWVQIGSDFDHVMLESVTVERGTIRYKWGCSLAEWTARGN